MRAWDSDSEVRSYNERMDPYAGELAIISEPSDWLRPWDPIVAGPAITEARIEHPQCVYESDLVAAGSLKFYEDEFTWLTRAYDLGEVRAYQENEALAHYRPREHEESEWSQLVNAPRLIWADDDGAYHSIGRVVLVEEARYETLYTAIV